MKIRLTVVALILCALFGVFIAVNAYTNKEKEYEVVLRVTVNNPDSFEFELVRSDEKVILNEPHFWHTTDPGEEAKGILKISFGGEYWQCGLEKYIVPTKFYISPEQRSLLHKWGVGSSIVLNYHKTTVNEDLLSELRNCSDGGLTKLRGLVQELRINQKVTIQHLT